MCIKCWATKVGMSWLDLYGHRMLVWMRREVMDDKSRIKKKIILC